MKRIVVIEGACILIIALIGIAEGLRLVLNRDPRIIYDTAGPDFFIILLNLALLVTGIVHFRANYSTSDKADFASVTTSDPMTTRAASMLAVLGIYAFLIDIVGYVLASAFFFLAEFSILRINSWLTNTVLAIVCTVAYYIVFIRYCNMIFPRGILY